METKWLLFLCRYKIHSTVALSRFYYNMLNIRILPTHLEFTHVLNSLCYSKKSGNFRELVCGGVHVFICCCLFPFINYGAKIKLFHELNMQTFRMARTKTLKIKFSVNLCDLCVSVLNNALKNRNLIFILFYPI